MSLDPITVLEDAIERLIESGRDPEEIVNAGRRLFIRPTGVLDVNLCVTCGHGEGEHGPNESATQGCWDRNDDDSLCSCDYFTSTTTDKENV